jgi:8-oxo-dGTP pyrophosphatase MutT (NUDIX family)
MFKIYFDNKPLFLVDKKDKIADYLERKTTLFIEDDPNNNAIETLISQLQEPGIYAGVFLAPDEMALVDAFKERFTIIKAAGGFVSTKDDEYLFIYRKEKWDLPKGKLDEGEDIETCAVREVKEETGLKDAQIDKHLCTTFHTYHQDKKHILKETWWYLMAADKQELQPQQDEGIQKCEWVKKEDLEQYLTGTYGLIRDVVDAAHVKKK